MTTRLPPSSKEKPHEPDLPTFFFLDVVSCELRGDEGLSTLDMRRFFPLAFGVHATEAGVARCLAGVDGMRSGEPIWKCSTDAGITAFRRKGVVGGGIETDNGDETSSGGGNGTGSGDDTSPGGGGGGPATGGETSADATTGRAKDGAGDGSRAGPWETANAPREAASGSFGNFALPLPPFALEHSRQRTSMSLPSR